MIQTVKRVLFLILVFIQVFTISAEETELGSSDVDASSLKLEEAHLLFFYKYKTELNLNFVNTILPHLEFIQQNLSSLLKSNETFTNFRTQHSALETKLVSLEERIYDNRKLLENYSTAYDQAAKEMATVRDYLIQTISSQSNLALSMYQ